MTGTSILTMLLGAALVAIGVLSAALADRIRGLRVSREAAPRTRAQSASAVITVVEPAPVKRAPRAEAKVQATDGGEDVIAALVASGFKKPIATEATWGCSAADRATIEGWTRAALRAASRGGMS